MSDNWNSCNKSRFGAAVVCTLFAELNVLRKIFVVLIRLQQIMREQFFGFSNPTSGYMSVYLDCQQFNSIEKSLTQCIMGNVKLKCNDNDFFVINLPLL